jgi:hypothetical protein
MLSDTFLEYVLTVFRQTQSTWVQLHISDPGGGLQGLTNERRRRLIEWAPIVGPMLTSKNTLRWDEVQGIPGYPATFTHVSLWSAPEDGELWGTSSIMALRVPHLSTFEIPAGLTLSFGEL